MLTRTIAWLTSKLSREEYRSHLVMLVVCVRVEVLSGLANAASQSHSSRQLLRHLTHNCLFRRFIRERATARQKMLSPKLDRSNMVINNNHNVDRSPLFVLNI